MKKRLRLLIGTAAVLVIIFAGWQLFHYYSSAGESDRANQKFAELAVKKAQPQPVEKSAAPVYREGALPSEVSAAAAEDSCAPSASEAVLSAEPAPIEVDFSVLKSECPDIAAWLYCEDTPINLPVVQGEDNEYYLHRLTDGTLNSNGTLFIDCRGAADFSDFNTVIYGHNMKSGRMFGSLQNYKDPAYYKAHPVLWLLTPGGVYKAEAAAGAVVPADSGVYSSRKEEMSGDAAQVFASSAFKSGLTFEPDARWLTLSTCSYEYENARYVLLCRLTLQGES